MENKLDIKNNTEKLLDKSEYINKIFYKIFFSDMTFISPTKTYYIKCELGINHFYFPTEKFYFYDLNMLQDILCYYEQNHIVCEIEIPEHASVWYDDFKGYHTYDVIIKKKKINITEFVELNKLEETLMNISKRNFKFIKNPTEKMCIEYEKYKNNLYIKLGSEYNDKIFYKVINKNMTNFNFTYKLGLNELMENYDPYGCCTRGGFYFCELQHLKYWLKLHPYGYIYEVRLPSDALVCAQSLKYKADKIIISNPVSIIEFIKLHKIEEEILDINSLYYFTRTGNIIIEIIKTNGLLLEHAKIQTLEMCIEAVKQNKMALTFVNLEFFDECLKVLMTI